MATPIFQQGEHVIRRGEVTRYYKGKNGWSNTTGVLWLTNQRLVYWAGFGNQRNWPLDHIIKVQTGIIDTVATVTIEFDNGMLEWFALEDQNSWITAILGMMPSRPVLNPAPERSETAVSYASAPNKKLLVIALAAMGIGLMLCMCAVLATVIFSVMPVDFAG